MYIFSAISCSIDILNISRNDIKEFYNKQNITKLMKPIRKPKYFNSYRANYPSHIYQLDIINYSRYKINNYQYILCLIDVYSRLLIARAMTNREMTTIIKNFEDMIDEIGPPYKLQCDNEFNKKDFIEVLQKYDIQTRFSDPYEQFKNPIVERVNGTLQTLSPVYELNEDEDLNLDIAQPTEEAKEHKKHLKHKQLGIDENNIIEGKRERKQVHYVH